MTIDPADLWEIDDMMPKEEFRPPPQEHDRPRRYKWIGECLDHPEIMKPPPMLVTHLAWAGRLTLFAAEEKAGKSTLAGQGVGAAIRGNKFLDETCKVNRVLWVGLDEPIPDAVSRLARYNLPEESVALTEEHLNPDELAAMCDDLRPNLIVIDTLTEWASGLVEDFNSAGKWTPVLRGLREVIRPRNIGCILLHHTVRGGGRYADSRQVGASVDVIVEMRREMKDPLLRYMAVRGRRVGNYNIRLTFSGGNYQKV